MDFPRYIIFDDAIQYKEIGESALQPTFQHPYTLDTFELCVWSLYRASKRGQLLIVLSSNDATFKSSTKDSFWTRHQEGVHRLQRRSRGICIRL